MSKNRTYLFFRRLLKDLDNQLDYSFGLDKYKLFQSWLQQEPGLLERLVTSPPEKTNQEETSFLTTCRLLFLQDPADADLFDQIINDALATERTLYQRQIHRLLKARYPEATPQEAEEKEEEKQPKPPEPPGPKEKTKKEEPEVKEEKESFYQEEVPAETEQIAEIPLRATYQPVENAVEAQQKLVDLEPRRYIFSKDYLPIGRRQMAKTWRYLEYEIPDRDSDEIHIKATIDKIAKDGFFSDPVYHPLMQNKAGGLAILLDRGGSMAPFHAFSDELVLSARTDGGHKKAAVLYFHNVPQGHLSQPEAPPDRQSVALDVFCRRIAAAHTAVLIVSDGGAARGRFNAQRINNTWKFLNTLKRHAASVAWLNPMPANRWRGSSAPLIAQRVDMFPVLEAGYLGFDKAVKVLRGQRHA